MHGLEIKEEADKIFFKLSRKNPQLLSAINRKVEEIKNNPQHVYKFLRKPLQGFNRVHIANQFVLVFKIDHQRKCVVIFYFDHRDNVYKWRP